MALLTKKGIADAARRARNRAEFVARLKRDGFKYLSSGGFSEVFRRGKKFVVKVGFEGKAHRDGYAAFAEWLHKGQRERDEAATLPEFPRVMHFARHGDAGLKTDYFVAILERLDALTDDGKEIAMNMQRETSNGRSGPGVLSDTAKRACAVLRERFSAHWVLDMHGSNFLMRGKTVVITDPISYAR